MQTKSNIQLIMEYTNHKLNVYNNLYNLTEQYDVVDSVFDFNGREFVKGYFEPIKEYNDLKSIVNEMQPNQGIRIIHDKYVLGNLYNKITECKTTDISTVLEIKPSV